MNTVSLTGHLHNDPARRTTTRGVVAGFRLAVDDRPNRIWIDIEAWGHLAGIVASNLTRRRHIAVAGRLAHREYHDRDGNARSHYYVIADRISFLDRPDRHSGDARDRSATASN